jgi:hypothetical protein
MYRRSLRTLEVCLIALSVLGPSSLAAADAITLEWNANSGGTAGYKLYVGTQSGSYTQNFDVGPATSYTFTSAVAGQRYCFALTAYSSSQVESAKSSEVCGFSNAPPTLTNPGNRSSTVGQPTSVQLTGSDPEGRPLSFTATGLPPGLSLMASTGYISGTGTTTGNYTVRVGAFDGVLSSAQQTFTWAMSGGGTTPPPPPPSGTVTLTAQPTDFGWVGRVRLTWTTASWTEAWIYRDGELISETDNDGAFTDYIWSAGGEYTYRVCGPNGTACSSNVTVSF